MAAFGASYPLFNPSNAGNGVVLGKLVSANLTVNLSSGELYADDQLTEQASDFVSGSLAMETDDLSDEKAAPVFGAVFNSVTGILTYNEEDASPVGVLGYYKRIMRNGVKSFKGFVYPCAKAVLSANNAQTKGSSITFQTSQINFTILPNPRGDWRKTQEFATEALVVEWINLRCGRSGIRSHAGFNRILYDRTLFSREGA